MKVITNTLNSSQSTFTLTAYIQENYPDIEKDRLRPAFIICPGGGYEKVTPREGEPVALQLLARDFQAFVLSYSVAPAPYPTALLELAESVRIVRKNAVKWHVNPNKIFILGFSAGGHLAASLATQWDRLLKDHYNLNDIQPNGLVLGYPVITNGTFGHQNSFRNLLGKQINDPLLITQTSLEKQVTTSVPKTFIWHTAADTAVLVENSLLFVEALRKSRVGVELHVFTAGEHGLSLGTAQSMNTNRHFGIQPEVQIWPDLLATWVTHQF